MSTAHTFVLVHGAFADRNAFNGLSELLQVNGRRVVTLDLAGHGADTTDPHAITLDTYVAQVEAIVRAEPASVVLVGHSMAGMVVSQVAEREPAKVRAIVYIAAYLPTSGQTLQSLAETDAASLVGANMVFAPDYSTVTVRLEHLVDAICADCPPPVQQYIVSSHRPEPLAPFQGAVDLTDARFGSVPKGYIATTADRAVTPDLQGRMLAAYPNMPRRSIDAGHLPFISQPAATAKAIEELVQELAP